MSYLASLRTILRPNGVWVDPRLFVLSVKDKDDPKGIHLADILIERTEDYVKHPHTGELLKATVEFGYQRLVARGDRCESFMTTFRATYDGHSNSVSLVSGGLFLDLDGLKGQRIGTYLMSSIVRWAKQWPTATVQRIELLQGQAGADNKERRNRFYERYGLKFTFADVEATTGASLPMEVDELIEVDSWKSNVEVLPLDAYIAGLLDSRRTAVCELGHRTEALRDWLAVDKERRKRPLRWAFGEIFG